MGGEYRGQSEFYGTLMEENMLLKVGNGNKIKFWRDGWIDQVTLTESFPDLFSICKNLKPEYVNAG